MRMVSGVTDQVIYFVAVDSTDYVTRKTGLSGFTVYRSRNGGAATGMTTPTTAELDATNMPGVYSLLLDEDMTIDAGDDSQEMVFHISVATMAPVTRTIELYRAKITAGNTLATAATGEADANVTEIAGAAVNTASAQLGVNVVNAAGTAWGSGAITAASIAADAITAAKIADGAIDANTFAAGAITASAIAADAIGASELAADAVAEIAGAVWDIDATGHQTQGTFGQAIGDPAADTNTIFKAVVTDATGATVGVDVAAVLDDTGTAGVIVASLAANSITAGVIAADAIGASELAADAVTEIANAVWDTDATGHQTQGTFGQAIGDPAADTNTIYKAVVTDATGATVGVDVAAVLDDTGTAGVVVASLAAGSITAAVVATGAIDADALAADAGTEIGTAVWATAARTVTAATNITSTGGTVPITAGGLVSADVTAISTDTAAADNLEAAADGTGYNLGNGSVVAASVTGNVGGNVGGNVTGTIGGLTAAALKDFFDTDSTTTYASAVAGSVVKEIADNAGGGTPPTAAEIADAVWDEDATAHQTQGTFGQAIGDPAADTNSIYKATVTDATGATVGVDVAAILDDTGTSGVIVASLAAGSITSGVIAADAIGASELAADAANEIADALLDRAAGVETGVTVRQAMRLYNSALFGKASGLGTTNALFRDVGDTKNRIDATVDANGNRTAVTLDSA